MTFYTWRALTVLFGFAIIILFSLRLIAVEKLESQQRHTIVIVSLEDLGDDRAWSVAERRIREEMSLSNFDVVVETCSDSLETDHDKELEILANKHRAAAALRIQKVDNDKAMVTLVSTRTDKDDRRTVLFIDGPQNGENAEVAAFKVAEAIKAIVIDRTTMNIQSVERKEGDDRNGTGEAKGKTVAPIDRSRMRIVVSSSNKTRGSSLLPLSRFQLSTRFLGSYSPGGTGLIGGPSLGMEWHPFKNFLLGVEISLFAVDRGLTASRSKAAVDALLGRGIIGVRHMLRNVIHLSAGLVVGLCYLWTKGSTDTIANTRTDETAMAYVGIKTALSFVITERIRIPINASIGAIPPGVRIYLGNEKAATYGLPIVEAGLGIAVIFF